MPGEGITKRIIQLFLCGVGSWRDVEGFDGRLGAWVVGDFV